MSISAFNGDLVNYPPVLNWFFDESWTLSRRLIAQGTLIRSEMDLEFVREPWFWQS